MQNASRTNMQIFRQQVGQKVGRKISRTKTIHRHSTKIIVGFWLAILISAMAVISIRHENRLAFVEWRNAENHKIEMQAEHGRLLLEKATWARRRNIVQDAQARLAMTAPAPTTIITLKPAN